MTAKPRKFLPRESPKRRAVRLASGRTAWTTIVNRGGKPKAKKRKPSETLRIYGGEDRLVWVASQPCIICGLRACDNAHVATGGMGRKADARFIVPLCSPDHRELHQIGVASFEKRYSIDLLQLAAQTEAAWRASSRTRAPK